LAQLLPPSKRINDAVTDGAPQQRPSNCVPRLSALLPMIFAVVMTAACSTQEAANDSGSDLSVLTLNLHTYQEMRTAGIQEVNLTAEAAQQRIEAYGPILDRIAAGIVELDPDIICLQEVGEWAGDLRSDPDLIEFGVSDSNMVHQILARLPAQRYQVTMDWSHFGYNVWLEGSAILSKYPLLATDSRFISDTSTNPLDTWKARNVPMAKTDVPQIGTVTAFSVHTGWWDDPEEPFQEQYRRLLEWAHEAVEPSSITILCGDFNIPAGTPMYEYLFDGTNYADTYLLANPGGMRDATAGGGIDGWEDSDRAQRIDYILMNDDSTLEVTRAHRVFTEDYLGRVSDHVGVYAEFEISRVPQVR
jgi:maltose 6'-phosphate phosphatase